MIKNFFKFILSKLTDHLVGLGLGLLITSSAVLEFFTKIKPLSGFLVPFILSRWSDLLLFVVLLIFTARHYWSNHRNYGSDKIPNPPKYHASHDGKIEEREYEGVIWKLLVGTNQNPSKGEIRREGIIVWPHPNPYCIQCDFELGRIRNKWYCLPCKKRYKIPHDLRHNTQERVRRIFSRMIAQWGHNNFGLLQDDEKPTSVIIRELQKNRPKNIPLVP